MSYFLTLSDFDGNDQDAAAKKLALMFRMAPQQAYTILEKISKGQVWQTPKGVSDKQASVAENYLRAIGFQVERYGEQEEVDPMVDSAPLEEEPQSETPQPQSDTASASEAVVEATPPSSSNGLFVGFHGTGGGLFKIMLVNWILTFLTLGIYSFWGKTKVRRFLCEHSSFAGDRFYYHGTGGELFRGALIFGGMFALFNMGIYSIGQLWGLDAQVMAQTLGTFLIVFLLPIIMVGAFKYRLSRTAWRGIRFSFRGRRKSALWLYIKGYLLTMLTLGLYMPYFTIHAQNFWRSGSYYGNQPFKYDGKGKDIVKAFLLMVLMYILTMSSPIFVKQLLPGMGEDQALTIMLIMWIPLIIAYMFYTVFLDRYNWSKTEFAGGRFKYDATGWQWFFLNFTNFLIIVLTLGFGIPFATVRSRQFLADHLAVAGDMQLSQVVQEAQKSGALGEGAADGFDMDIDIGI